MAHRLKTKAGRALYALRKQTVEPVFGIIKSVMGFRQFSLRAPDEGHQGMDAGLPRVEFETLGGIASSGMKSRENPKKTDNTEFQLLTRQANSSPTRPVIKRGLQKSAVVGARYGRQHLRVAQSGMAHR